jgi:hypothetical protein
MEKKREGAKKGGNFAAGFWIDGKKRLRDPGFVSCASEKSY